MRVWQCHVCRLRGQDLGFDCVTDKEDVLRVLDIFSFIFNFQDFGVGLETLNPNRILHGTDEYVR